MERAHSIVVKSTSGWGEPIHVLFCSLGRDNQSSSHRIDFELQSQLVTPTLTITV